MDAELNHGSSAVRHLPYMLYLMHADACMQSVSGRQWVLSIPQDLVPLDVAVERCHNMQATDSASLLRSRWLAGLGAGQGHAQQAHLLAGPRQECGQGPGPKAVGRLSRAGAQVAACPLLDGRHAGHGDARGCAGKRAMLPVTVGCSTLALKAAEARAPCACSLRHICRLYMQLAGLRLLTVLSGLLPDQQAGCNI